VIEFSEIVRAVAVNCCDEVRAAAAVAEFRDGIRGGFTVDLDQNSDNVMQLEGLGISVVIGAFSMNSTTFVCEELKNTSGKLTLGLTQTKILAQCRSAVDSGGGRQRSWVLNG
jgi:hypothetical protein